MTLSKILVSLLAVVSVFVVLASLQPSVLMTTSVPTKSSTLAVTLSLNSSPSPALPLTCVPVLFVIQQELLEACVSTHQSTVRALPTGVPSTTVLHPLVSVPPLISLPAHQLTVPGELGLNGHLAPRLVEMEPFPVLETLTKPPPTEELLVLETLLILNHVTLVVVLSIAPNPPGLLGPRVLNVVLETKATIELQPPLILVEELFVESPMRPSSAQPVSTPTVLDTTAPEAVIVPLEQPPSLSTSPLHNLETEPTVPGLLVPLFLETVLLPN